GAGGGAGVGEGGGGGWGGGGANPRGAGAGAGGGVGRRRADAGRASPRRGLGRGPEGAAVKFVIVGCGRVGAALAEAFDNAGHDVVVLDTSTRAFDRLSEEFKGQAIRGDGTDEDVLRKAGVDGADVLLAFTE